MNTDYFFFAFNNMSAIYLAINIAYYMSMRSTKRNFLFLVILMYLIVIYIVILICGLLGKLTPLSICIILFILSGLTLFLNKKFYKISFNDKIYQTTPKSLHNNYYFVISFCVFIGVIILWLYNTILEGSRFSWDDFTYHASIPTHWLLKEKIFFVPYPYQTYYPFNAEIISLWFMLPFRSDTFVSISGLCFCLLAIISMFQLMKACGCSMITSYFTVALFLLSPSIQKTAQTFSANDLAAPAMLLAAMVFLLPKPFLRKADNFLDAFCCGICAGFAAGIKISFIPAIIIVGCAFFMVRYFLFSSKDTISCITLFLIGIIGTTCFWYVRNIILTGNPLFPAQWLFFDGPLNSSLLNRSKLIWWFLKKPLSLKQNLYIVKSLFDWPVILGMIAIFGYAGWIYIFCFRKKTALLSYQKSSLLIILCSGLIMLFLFPFMPFSGTHEEPHGWLIVENRYIVFSFIGGLILWGAFVERLNLVHFLPGLIWYVLFVFVIITTYSSFELIIICIGCIGCFILLQLLKFVKSIEIRKYHISLIAYLFIFTILLIYPLKKRSTEMHLQSWGEGLTIGDFQVPSPCKAWIELEKLPHGSRIGFFAFSTTGNLHYYPSFGRKFQHIPVPLRNNGSREQPLHISWDWWGQKDRETNVTKDELTFNLMKESIDYIILSKGILKGKWPHQAQYFEKTERFRKIFDNGQAQIWKLNNPY
ncbi:MAG: hypothetical protein NC935_03745 [Candidatus Omnitrophica bacterium]|nr:hypothetical protein [Candidatus Omnitrophota bacterium]